METIIGHLWHRVRSLTWSLPFSELFKQIKIKILMCFGTYDRNFLVKHIFYSCMPIIADLNLKRRLLITTKNWVVITVMELYSCQLIVWKVLICVSFFFLYWKCKFIFLKSFNFLTWKIYQQTIVWHWG